MRIDCMISENYLNEFNRACNFYSSCGSCPIQIHCGVEHQDTQDMIAAVQRFSDENPRKTILEDLLGKYPTTPLRDDGTPAFLCPHSVGLKDMYPCHHLCIGCWNRPA